MHREPDLEALRALALVAEQGSISSASSQLGVSQQAVSLRIRNLESDLRTRLLVRSARGSRLTPSGELVVGWAAGLLRAADDFTGTVDSLRAHRAQIMDVAASLTVAEHLLPEWIARWRIQRGDDGPVVRLQAENSSAVINAVREGTADLGFIESPTVPTDLGSRTVGHDSIEVVVQRQHPWARKGAVSARELTRTGLVLRESGSGTRQALENAMAEAGHPLQAEPVAEFSTTLGIRSAVMAGVAPGALSSLAVSEDVRTGRLVRIRIRNLQITRPLTAIWAGSGPSRNARDFLEVISRDAKG
ncbi:LysR family transcriptional regulator [Kocuria coralli]|uniref:LysR family transcriptional regulator n=1 Tax=Kocuria coralli TaxID=1461025 RepID=A0A5J5KV36_9MICC|nr:LysR family transcriptional regulator [Kocuria coralli]KAA9393513.1 LysR family transcriptional regulator [Kocuria coralli]